MKSNLFKKVATFILLAFGFTYAQAQMVIATIPAEITTAVTDLEGVWDLLQPVILSVGIFVVLWRFFRKGARKVG